MFILTATIERLEFKGENNDQVDISKIYSGLSNTEGVQDRHQLFSMVSVD